MGKLVVVVNILCILNNKKNKYNNKNNNSNNSKHKITINYNSYLIICLFQKNSQRKY